MNFLHSVRFRLFALCISLLVVLGGANLLLGSINQQHEAQIHQLQEQYRRVSVIFSVHQEMVTYRYWQGQVNDAIFLKNTEYQSRAEGRLRQATTVLNARLDEFSEFDSLTAPELRAAIAALGPKLRVAVAAVASNSKKAEQLVAEATEVVNTIDGALRAAALRERTAAQDIEREAREKAAARARTSLAIIGISSALGLILTLVVLNSIVRPMQSIIRALRMVNSGEESIDLPPVSPDEFGDMAVALRQFRDQAERLRRLAYVDPLTGVGNRARFEEALQGAIGTPDHENTVIALFFVDIDNFRAVNDSFGHRVGDRYLCEAVVRLQRFVPDDALLCRYGGDKFAVLLEQVPAWDSETIRSHLRDCGGRILQGMAEPFELDGNWLPMSVSLGASVFPSDGQNVEQLISSAEAAMYLAKRQGRNKLRFATPELTGDARKQLTTATEIRRGLESREFEPYFQPVVDVASGTVVGAEALLRWHHPQRGVVSAGEFISAAEAAGLIHALGEYCIVRSCEHAMEWGGDGHALRVSVNLSARQIEDGSALALLRRLHSGALRVGTQSLDFEITETEMLQHLDQVQRTLRDIQAMGHSFSVDDFGTGYSSLVYLQRFPVNRIKIDRSFVSRVDVSREAQAIVAATIALARSLDLEVVAEGVETPSQLRRLRELGCTLQQGFLFTPALPAAEFRLWRASPNIPSV